jgi:hypothetical protein
MNIEKRYFEQEAKHYGVEYAGMQIFLNGKILPMYRHKSYGTFVVGRSETLLQAIHRKKEQFESAKKE